MSTHRKNIYFLLSGIVFASVIFFPVVKVLADDIDVTATVPAICGNNFQEGAEECDDGNVVDGDGCSSVCENEGGGGDDDDDNGGGGAPPAPVVPVPFCGDGVVNGADECDDGNGNHDDFCNNICKIPVCGDGQSQGAEQCDDGNVLNHDGCSQVCIVEPPIVCGDGQAQGVEQCDDGNDVERDGCSTQCFLDPAPVCGNAIVEFGEICDDGNDIGRDGCSLQCLPENPSRCGNRLVEFGEQCDDGNLAGGDGCSGWCQQEPAPVCGNGLKERGEVCDDGNLRDDDGCNNRCQFVPLPGTVCGNGVREAGEQCDDGNLHGGDGCTGACQNENNEDAHGNNAQNPDVQNPDPVVPVVENQDPNEEGQNPNEDNQAPNEEGQNSDSTASSSSPIAPIFEVSPPTTTPIFSGVEKDAPFTKKVSVIAQNVSKNIANTVQFLNKEAQVIGKVAREVANNPQVEETTKTVVAPAAAAVVVASVVPSLASILIPFLRFVFLQPLLLFGRKKRQAWGQIYNSLTKLPVDLAMIRLIDAKTKRIVQSRVTDAAGRYFFIAEPGEYLLEVAKPGFSFPSSLLQSVKTDGKLVDIYHGELVQVTASGIGITPNIPLDPVGANKTPRRIVWEKRWRVVQHGISVSGIFLTLVSLYIAPVWYMWIFLGVHILAYVGFMRFVKPKKPNGWGLVSEKSSNAPLGNAVVRLFTKQYNKLVSTQVTDKEGRYAFLVGPSEYYVTYEKKGYKQHTTESFQVGEHVDGSVIKEKVSLEKEK